MCNPCATLNCFLPFYSSLKSESIWIAIALILSKGKKEGKKGTIYLICRFAKNIDKKDADQRPVVAPKERSFFSSFTGYSNTQLRITQYTVNLHCFISTCSLSLKVYNKAKSLNSVVS